MMKKIQFKGIKLSQPRQEENQAPGDVQFLGGLEAGSEVDERSMTVMREHDSQRLPNQNYSDENNTSPVMNHKKKEKFGIFRNLRRRLRSNFQRKSEESDVNIEEHCQASPTNSKLESKRHKHTGKCKMNLCNKPSNSNSSQSSESLDLNIQFQRHRKIDDMWPNKDGKENDSRKEKSSCKSKDISHFQSGGGSRVICDCDFETLHGVENSEGKICNVSPVLNAPCRQISVVCHMNSRKDTGSQNNSNSMCHFQEQKLPLRSISDGAILKEPPKVWSLTQELFRLSKFGWYWGPITRREAERKLAGQPDGAFLVRDSSDERYLLSLSFRSYGRTLHTRIEHCNGKFIFDAQPDTEGYPSIVDLIENSMNDPQTGICSYSRLGSPSPPIYPVRLTKPVSRFTQVRSLQYLCRFVIRQYTRYDHIEELPLPNSIKGWIGENQY